MSVASSSVKVILPVEWIPPIWDDVQVEFIKDLYLTECYWSMSYTVAELIGETGPHPTPEKMRVEYMPASWQNDVHGALDSIYVMLNEEVEDLEPGETLSPAFYRHKEFMNTSYYATPCIASLITYCFNTVLTPMLALYYAHQSIPELIDVQYDDLGNNVMLDFDLGLEQKLIRGGLWTQSYLQ